MRIFGSSAGCLSVLFGLAFGLPALAEPSVDLDGPTAGWRYSGLLEQPDAPRVAYPTPPIDRGGQRGRSLIEGHLRELVGTERAQRLVVNGNPLPLYRRRRALRPPLCVRPRLQRRPGRQRRRQDPQARAVLRGQPLPTAAARAWCWVGTIRRPSLTCISSPPMASTPTGASAPEQQRRPRSGRRRRARPGDVHHGRAAAPT